MIRCSQADCGWMAIAPSERAALNQYESHLLETHVERVETEVPDGYVQVRTEDGEWKTIPCEKAREFYDD